MSSTRTTSNHAELRQERFSSAPELRGDYILLNLVARRLAVLDDPAKKRLVLWLQEMSTRQGFQTHPTCSQFSAWPLSFPASYKGETGLDLVALEVLSRARMSLNAENRRTLKDWMVRLALDPDNSAFNYPQKYTKVPKALTVLETVMQDCLAEPLMHVADTSTKRALWDMFDYCWDSRSLVLACGEYRIGKTLASQSYCQIRGGHVRYVSLSSTPTNEAFYRQLARSLGVACSLQLKAGEMAERVTAALIEQNVMVIFDEGQYLLPQTLRTKQSPQRLTWVMTSLCNRGVPVAVVANKDWPRLIACLKRSVPWFGWAQWEGRLRLNIDLPDTLTENDLREIARVLTPEADKATLTLLAGLALRQTGYISTIEAVVSRARYLAKKQGAFLDYDFCQIAMAEIDPTFTPQVSDRALRPIRETSAHLRRGYRGDLEESKSSASFAV